MMTLVPTGRRHQRHNFEVRLLVEYVEEGGFLPFMILPKLLNGCRQLHVDCSAFCNQR